MGVGAGQACRLPCLGEDQAVHVERKFADRDLGLGAGQTDGGDEHAHDRLLMREHMLDPGANLGLGGVAAPDILGHRATLGLAAMDSADPTLGLQPAFVALAAVGRVGPDIRGDVVARHHVAQHAPVVALAIRRLALADEAECGADLNAALVAEARDRNVRLRPAIAGRPGLREFERPQRASVSSCRALAGSCGHISVALLPSLTYDFSASVFCCFGVATNGASTICPPIGR